MCVATLPMLAKRSAESRSNIQRSGEDHAGGMTPRKAGERLINQLLNRAFGGSDRRIERQPAQHRG